MDVEAIRNFTDAQLVHDAVSFFAVKYWSGTCIMLANPAPAFGGFLLHHEV
jgi:hypothetical protein